MQDSPIIEDAADLIGFVLPKTKKSLVALDFVDGWAFKTTWQMALHNSVGSFCQIGGFVLPKNERTTLANCGGFVLPKDNY